MHCTKFIYTLFSLFFQFGCMLPQVWVFSLPSPVSVFEPWLHIGITWRAFKIPGAQTTAQIDYIRISRSGALVPVFFKVTGDPRCS